MCTTFTSCRERGAVNVFPGGGAVLRKTFYSYVERNGDKKNTFKDTASCTLHSTRHRSPGDGAVFV